MVTYHNIQQGSPEWDEIRKGKLTASHATAIAANGKGLNTYCKKIAVATLAIPEKRYISKDMERGIELETFARQYYEFETSQNVDEVGFVENAKFKNVGCSPDGIVNSDGGIEIKARNNEKHFDLILGETKEIPFNQIQMTLLITERKWWDFVSYNPNFKEKPIFIYRVLPDLDYHKKLIAGFEKGNELIKEFTEQYRNFTNKNF